MLKRKILNELLEWKAQKNKLALLVRGARQVGKTFIIRQFGKNHYKHFVEINFERQPLMKKAFEGNLDARSVLLNLSSLGVGELEKGHTLIFFDEIQSCPNARTAIKFLVEDGKCDYIESGSLLGISYRDVSSYPVGYEQQIDMFALDFEEFLWAKGMGADVIVRLHEHYTALTPLDDFLHERMMSAYYEYLVVGGMPAVVMQFLASDDFNATLKMQHSLLKSYRDDISRYAGKQKILIKNMMDAMPEQLSKKNKRFILADLEKGATAKKYENASIWLTEAGIAYNCFNVSSLEQGLSFCQKRNLYKLYSHDTGLLCAQGFKGIQWELMLGNLDIDEGGIAENSVACALAKNGIPLYYYDKKSRAELDFVISEPNGLCLVEVKSGKDYKRHASLTQAPEYAHCPISRRIVLSKHNLSQSQNGITYLPLYMAMFL